jgi:hypothetical protein
MLGEVGVLHCIIIAMLARDVLHTFIFIIFFIIFILICTIICIKAEGNQGADEGDDQYI